MDDMGTETSQTNEQLASLHQRLTIVEHNLVVLTETAATKADVHALEARIIKWMLATLIGVAILNSALVLTVVKLMQL